MLFLCLLWDQINVRRTDVTYLRIICLWFTSIPWHILNNSFMIELYLVPNWSCLALMNSLLNSVCLAANQNVPMLSKHCVFSLVLISARISLLLKLLIMQDCHCNWLTIGKAWCLECLVLKGLQFEVVVVKRWGCTQATEMIELSSINEVKFPPVVTLHQ